MTNEMIKEEMMSVEELDAVNGGGAGTIIKAVGGTFLGIVAIGASVLTANPGLAVAGGAALITGVSGIADATEGK